jgi:hypothetical protein
MPPHGSGTADYTKNGAARYIGDVLRADEDKMF